MAEMKFTKETGNYSGDIKNYVAEREITVTITLAEYRELVSFKASNEPTLRALRLEKYNSENEVKRLKEKIADLMLKYSPESEDEQK